MTDTPKPPIRVLWAEPDTTPPVDSATHCENEITPGMMQAGLEALFDYPEFANGDTTIRAVYMAMEAARRDQRPASQLLHSSREYARQLMRG